MSQPSTIPEPERWLAKLIEGELSEAERAELNRLLRDDPSLRELYRKYMLLDALLRWEIAPPLMHVADEGRETGDLEIWRFGDLEIGAAVELPRQLDDNTQSSSFILHPSSPSLSPLSSPFPLRSTFVGGPVFSYMVATILLGLMLLGAWAFKVTHNYPDFVKQNNQRHTVPGDSSHSRPELVFVGQITGMKDCRWADPTTAPFAGAYVPLGRKYALTAGLMEISYRSGARVILEGPCTYEVESAAGGYLGVGKTDGTSGEEKRRGLAASAASRSAASRSAAGAKPPAANPKSPNPPNLQIFSPHTHGRRHRLGHGVRSASGRQGLHRIARVRRQSENGTDRFA